ncbi:MAG: ribosomal L7Ae/L30e/S12e/Gadd45 family protein [candidate division WOR-3 bacterium]|jgi:ribosomal protein L7Ae-like RNA K-turn-binding protein
MIDVLRLSKKAGKLKIGTTQVLKSLKNAKIIILAKDYSNKDKILKIAKKLNKEVFILDLSKKELGEIFNRDELGIVSINDEQLYKLFLNKKEVER